MWEGKGLANVIASATAVSTSYGKIHPGELTIIL